METSVAFIPASKRQKAKQATKHPSLWPPTSQKSLWFSLGMLDP